MIPSSVLKGLEMPFRYQKCTTGLASSMCPIHERRTSRVVTSTPHFSHLMPSYFRPRYLPQAHSWSFSGPKISSAYSPPRSGLCVR